MSFRSKLALCLRRVARAVQFAVRTLQIRILRIDPIRLLVLGYLSYVLLGWGLLCLPISRSVADAGTLDHLFTAMSAVSTTGLTTVSTSDTYSGFGEFVILMLIQFGGLGYMTISSFLMLAVAGDLSPLRRRLMRTALVLPTGFEIGQFLKVICWFTLAIELAGAIALYPIFLAHDAPQPLWQAIFHSVSAFCTAGFSLFNNSLEDYRDDGAVNAIIAVLSFLGAIGFIVLSDVARSLTSRKIRATMTTRVILWSTFWIVSLSTILFAFEEPAVAELTFAARWRAAFFQVMTASTTVGFNTLPIGSLGASTLFLLCLVMAVGASPSGTGGGIKTTTISALWAEMISVIQRREQTTFFGRAVPEARMRTAVANFVFYVFALSVGIFAFSLVNPAPLPDQIFECVSAIGTVGLSRGITGQLDATAKTILILLMLVGRVGPVVLGMAFFRSPHEEPERVTEDVAI